MSQVALLSAEDVAAMLGMSKDWVYSECRAGRIPHIKMGRYTRFRREAIEDWIRGREIGTTLRPVSPEQFQATFGDLPTDGEG